MARQHPYLVLSFIWFTCLIWLAWKMLTASPFIAFCPFHKKFLVGCHLRLRGISHYTAIVKQPPPLLANDLYPGALCRISSKPFRCLQSISIFMWWTPLTRHATYTMWINCHPGIPFRHSGSGGLALVACLITCSKNHAIAAITRRHYHTVQWKA